MACTLETAISFEPPPFCLPPFIDRKDPAAFFPLGPAAARIDRTSCFLRWDLICPRKAGRSAGRSSSGSPLFPITKQTNTRAQLRVRTKKKVCVRSGGKETRTRRWLTLSLLQQQPAVPLVPQDLVCPGNFFLQHTAPVGHDLSLQRGPHGIQEVLGLHPAHEVGFVVRNGQGGGPASRSARSPLWSPGGGSPRSRESPPPSASPERGATSRPGPSLPPASPLDSASDSSSPLHRSWDWASAPPALLP